MCANRFLAVRDWPPRCIIDNEDFKNESCSIINTSLISDRVRVGLNRAANGRVVFVGRHFADMVEKERELKRDGAVDGGTIRQTQATAGGDYRLGGRIASLDAMDRNSQTRSRYHPVTFEMLDLALGTIVWSGSYEMKKASQEPVLSR
mgnify:CR=1 FL=1